MLRLTINNGINWVPIFDSQPTASIGAVKICQKNPNIIWVGTGEGNPRNSSGVGRGIFKSLDGGKTWMHLGLEETEKISRIVLDLHNPDIAYVAALGTTWGENPQRGVFKTEDGGKTWHKILYIDEKTGAADLVMAPDNPNKLIASMWEHRRWPWFFKSGGPGSGLFITSDGGKNWKKLSPAEGLPQGDLGRIGITFAHSRPNIVYALVEASHSVLLRSKDGGYTWKTINGKPNIHGRPFYYSDIRVNPSNENIIYSLQTRLLVSEDGGKEFRNLTSRNQAHSDFQAMWLHPDGELIIVGTDGGIVTSFDRGKSWRFARNIPLGQFYHVSFDKALPYNVYGGLQDNGSWRGPSSVLTDHGIFNYHWRRVGGGDGFDTEPDPENNLFGYSMSQGGRLSYFNVKTGLRKSIRPTESDIEHRYNWNAGFAQDPFDPGTIYYGSQFVHRSPDRGRTWEIISPDLTTNDSDKQNQDESGGLTRDVTAAENHTTIMCISPSPVKKGVIWVGTDDGNVQLTVDNGKSWQLVSNSIKGVPPFSWIPHVEASKFNPACAFVVFDDHRRADWTSYAYVTDDYGKTWKNLVTEDIDGFIHVIEQDHIDKYLLFIGTEFGLFVSLDRGKEWFEWTSGLPTVPIRDLAVHPRDNDLIIGTHGRSIYILDDISFLREITSDMLKKRAYLFKPSDVYQFRASSIGSYSTIGDAEFQGQNRRNGILLTFYINPNEQIQIKNNETKKTKNPAVIKNPANSGKNKEENSKLKILILNEQGKEIRKITTDINKGINRINWDLREEALQLPGNRADYSSRRRRARRGVYALPGIYTVQLQYNDIKMKHSFQVYPDPRYKINLDTLKKNYTLSREIETWITKTFTALNEIKKAEKTIKTIVDMIDKDLKNKKEILEKAKVIKKKIKELTEIVRPDRNRQGIYDWSAPLSSKIFMLYGSVSNEFEPLNQATQVQMEKIKKLVTSFLAEYNRFFQTDYNDFKKLVTQSGFSIFKPFNPLNLDKE